MRPSESVSLVFCSFQTAFVRFFSRDTVADGLILMFLGQTVDDGIRAGGFGQFA